MKGAAKCFYAYIGFDCIATASEEVKNPKKTLPLSIILTLLIVSICYCGISAILSLIIPYYMINSNLPIHQMFEYMHISWSKYVLSAGALASISASLYASIFAVPRIIYSMSEDGLLFKLFSTLLPRVKTPVNAILFSGLLGGWFI